MTEKVKVFEEDVKKGVSPWVWLLPLLLLALAVWFFTRNRAEPNTAATAVVDQTKPDAVAGKPAAGNWTAATIADSIRTKGRIGFGANDVHFATNSAALEGDSQAVLDQTAQALQSNVGWKMQVVGYTDGTGSSASNEQLAEQRATNVMTYLSSHGVNQNRLSVGAKGSSDPVSTNNTDAGRAENRRVELIKK